jgi:hypothetical protein
MDFSAPEEALARKTEKARDEMVRAPKNGLHPRNRAFGAIGPGRR